MSKPENLEDLYTDELKDLWSANDQMLRTIKKIAPKATDPKLKDLLAKSPDWKLVKEVDDYALFRSTTHCTG